MFYILLRFEAENVLKMFLIYIMMVYKVNTLIILQTLSRLITLMT